MMDVGEMPETGQAVCICSGERVVVNADTHPDPSVRTVEVSFWVHGGHEGHPPSWRMRLEHAWAWLRGRPKTSIGVLLDQEGTVDLRQALEKADAITWHGEDE